jgi:hypothetical protein
VPKKPPPVVRSRTVAVIPGPEVDGWIRNMEFPQGSEMLDPETRARMAARRLAHHNERVAAAERELAAQRQRDELRTSHRGGRKAGAPNEKTLAVENLIKRNLKKYPDDERTAPNLRLRAERTAAGKKLLEGMAPSTWARHVRKVLNLAPD